VKPWVKFYRAAFLARGTFGHGRRIGGFIAHGKAPPGKGFDGNNGDSGHASILLPVLLPEFRTGSIVRKEKL
jgi:hypothetical protein